MNSNSDRLIELFGQAMQKESPAERAHFLTEVCQGDAELRLQLEALFRAHQEAGTFLKNTVAAATLETSFEHAGDSIGRYKLLQKIGEGGCGVVYMAEQAEPVRRRVALKVIKVGMDTKSVIARFEAERQALAMMDHPNIAKIYDGGATETGRPYFVMELVRGVRITDYCDQNNLPTEERLALFTQVCHAIQHAHQKGVIHRDIKPSNLLVTVNDGVAVPKVIDFGIAKATEQKLTDKTLFTAFDQFIGTPAYMSPEQAAMTSVDIDTRSDIYSLGVLLYELLTGRTPFDTKALLRAGLDEVRRTIREVEPPRPSTRLSTMLDVELTEVAAHRQSEPARLPTLIRGDLDWIVMKALEKDRIRRYETAAGFSADIQRYLTNEPITARPPSPVYRLQKFARRNKLAFAAAATVLSVLVLGTGVSTWQAVRATQAVRVAKDAGERTEQNLYASETRQAFECLEKDELGRALGLLNRHRPQANDSKDRRGWEWRYLWKLCQGDPHDFLEGVEGIIWWLEYSPSGKFLAVGLGQEVAIFDMTSKTIVAHVDRDKDPGGEPHWAVFTPDGKTLITARHDRVTLYESTHWTELPVQFPPVGGPIALSPDGNYLATMPANIRFLTGKEFKIAKIWDLRTLRVSLTLTNVDSPLVFSPDGKRLATDTPQGIKLWPLDSSTGPALLLEGSSNLLSHYSGYDSLRKTVAFSPNGKLVASGSSGNLNIKLWDATTGQRLDHDQLHGHRDALTGVAFSPDSKFVASAGFDSTIQIWDITNLKLRRKLRGQLGSIWAFAFAPDGKSLVSGGENGRADTIKIWPFDGGPQMEQQGLNDPWQPVWISTNGAKVITFGSGKGEYWDTRINQLLYILPRPDAPRLPDSPYAIVAPDGHAAYAGYVDGIVRFGNFATGEITARSGGHSTGVVALAVSPDGRTLVTGGRDAKLCWWELPASRLIRSQMISGIVNAVDFSPDGKILACASEDLKLSWWDGASGRLLGSSPMPKAVFRLAFSPNGKSLAGLNEGRTWLWDVATRSLTATADAPGERWSFSPDSTKFLTPAQLWDARHGRSLGGLKGHKTLVLDSVFSPDGRTIASGSEDVRIWNTDTQQEMLTLARPAMGSDHLMFSADGSTLVAGSAVPGGGGLRVWRAPTFEEIAAKERANQHNH